jgi:hypothetical protein
LSSRADRGQGGEPARARVVEQRAARRAGAHQRDRR